MCRMGLLYRRLRSIEFMKWTQEKIRRGMSRLTHHDIVIYGCEEWTLKQTERVEVFELRCFGEFLGRIQQKMNERTLQALTEDGQLLLMKKRKTGYRGRERVTAW